MLSSFRIQDNPVSATTELIRLLGVKVSSSAIKNQVYNHPDYPSILSISDSLKQWKIDNYVIQADKAKLKELPVPFIAHLRKQGGSFTTITRINDDHVVYKSEEGNKLTHKPINDFLQEWSGVTLLAEQGEHSGEKAYKQSRKKELLQSLKLPLIISIVVAFCTSALVYQYTNSFVFPAFSLLLTLKLAGLTVASLLLWYEIDKANPVLKQICGIGKQTNCSAVLNSKKARLFNVISWSEVGFFYFAGGFISLLVAGTDAAGIISILAWLNVLALPYTFFSVYYQWKVAKQWCPMCLAVQAVLVAEFIVVLSTNQLNQPINFVLTLVSSFLLPALVWFLLKPFFLQNQEAKRKKRELSKFKYDSRIFETLLQKQKQITVNADGLGITIGNPNATNTIIKVCNPYCPPCAKAHPIIDDLLDKNKDLKIQIMFNVTKDDTDICKPVKHLLAVAGENNEAATVRALDDWYLPEMKDYQIFAAKNPVNGQLEKQDIKIDAMSDWCEKTAISFTPTFFVNGFQLPEMYTIKELKYFLSN